MMFIVRGEIEKRETTNMYVLVEQCPIGKTVIT